MAYWKKGKCQLHSPTHRRGKSHYASTDDEIAASLDKLCQCLINIDSLEAWEYSRFLQSHICVKCMNQHISTNDNSQDTFTI